MLLTLAFMCLIANSSYGQFQYESNNEDHGRISYGLDVIKSAFSVINLRGYPIESQRFLTIEPVVRLGRIKPNRFWLAQPGVTYIAGMPFNATRLNMTGEFLKFGPEWHLHSDVGCALLATLSVWQTSGTIQTTATAFGPYIGAIPRGNGMTSGAEFQWHFDTHISSQWMARLNMRTNLFWKSDAGKAIETPYIPGLGLFIDSVNLSLFGPPPPTYHPVGFTVGATVQVFYTPIHHP